MLTTDIICVFWAWPWLGYIFTCGVIDKHLRVLSVDCDYVESIDIQLESSNLLIDPKWTKLFHTLCPMSGRALIYDGKSHVKSGWHFRFSKMSTYFEYLLFKISLLNFSVLFYLQADWLVVWQQNHIEKWKCTLKSKSDIVNRENTRNIWTFLKI